jgi:hypothetical protein
MDCGFQAFIGSLNKAGINMMLSANETRVTTNMKKPDEKITSTDVLIVGFGFSVIPLIRELERDGINFTIVSSRGSIWERLEQHNRLDFDLVSSMHSSLYSFELVNHDPSDRYPTAREFHVFIQKYLSLYRSRVIDDFVTLVENHASHSIVYTQSGRIFETKHLIVATAFRRKMNQLLNEFDYGSVKNQTIAFTGMGDSINLMISKLIPYNNRIVLITNPFFALDKLVFYDDVPYTLDQLEFHDIRHLSNMLYRKAITTGFELVVIFAKLLKLLSVDHIYLKHRLAYRWRNQITFKTFPRSPIPNGFMSIKFWPIDTYQNLFDNGSLPQAIQDGYLLNDIVFFLEQGLVELWPKSDTAIDREGKTIRWKDKIVAYDQIVEPDYEVPNLPDIIADHEGASKHKYQYVYKDNFMGVIPKDLRNIYFLGLTRPFTGGLNNIIEMQGLFVHKMITDPGYHREIHKNLEQRIRKYNNYYYYWDVRGKEHLVHYGFYTDDMARLMKINLRLRDCRSLRDLIIYFVFPNNAFKYRQSGRYEVPGVKDMMQKIYKNHLGYSIVVNYLLMYALLQLTAYVAVIVAYYRQELSGAAAALLFILVLLNPVTSFVAAYAFPRNSYLNPLMVAALVLTAFYPIPAIPIASMLLVFALTYVFRKLGWTRQFFNELRFKRKRKYKEFFKRYCDTFREVFFDTRSQTEQRDANRV